MNGLRFIALWTVLGTLAVLATIFATMLVGYLMTAGEPYQ
jgi:hypothetical protein